MVVESEVLMVFFVSAFFDTTEVAKIVLPKVLQNFKLYLLAQGTEPKRFSFFPRNIQYRARLKGPPSIFWSLATQWMLENTKRSPFQFFSALRLFSRNFGCCRREYFDTLNPFAIFEPEIWRRLGPFPRACFFFLLL